MLKITQTALSSTYQSHTMRADAHDKLAALMEREFPGVPFVAFETADRNYYHVNAVPVRFAELNGNTDTLCDDDNKKAASGVTLAVSTDKIEPDTFIKRAIANGVGYDTALRAVVKEPEIVVYLNYEDFMRLRQNIPVSLIEFRPDPNDILLGGIHYRFGTAPHKEQRK